MNWDIIEDGILCHKFDNGMLVVLKRESDGHWVGTVRAENHDVGRFHVNAATQDEATAGAVVGLNELATEAMNSWRDIVDDTEPALDADVVARLDAMAKEGAIKSGVLDTASRWPARRITIQVEAGGAPTTIELHPSSAGGAYKAVRSLNIKSAAFMQKLLQGGDIGEKLHIVNLGGGQ